MAISKESANKVLANLDQAAESLTKLAADGNLDKQLVANLVRDIDSFADKFEVAAFGAKSFAARRAKLAKVIKKDPDEAYMDTFDNTVKPLQTDADETFMHKMDPSFNGKGQDTFDADRSSTVSERDEYAVRDLNEFAGGTKKQPSWSKGPAGKSTKQGSAQPKKTWAP